MSYMTQAYLMEKFGLRLTIEQLSEVLNMPKGSIHNALSARKFNIPTYIDGKKRYADYRDVATYLDEKRANAAIPV